ncbi:MAG TPA: hypothetical protein VER83_03075 [Candidatus Nanopelagicales bacterium]|nr:hypothetical protein [Candidatus Nanopelagicales bacterium]
MSGTATPGRPAGERSSDLRVARLHLRGGTHALARAELEALAGRDDLDRDGILDLAEVRWRTGDLAGAGVAAAAWLEDGDDAGAPGALAHVISAEAAAARGALDAAAAHVDAAGAGLRDRATLDALLAGIAARAAWPWEGTPPAAASAPSPAPVAVSSPPAPPSPGPAPAPAVIAGTPLSPSAAELVAAGAALLAVAPERAAVVLALALRADRAAAEAVLGVLGAVEPEPAPAAALAFVRAEALRAAGRHDEARIAYASAERLALGPAEAGTPRSSQ